MGGRKGRRPKKKKENIHSWLSLQGTTKVREARRMQESKKDKRIKEARRKPIMKRKEEEEEETEGGRQNESKKEKKKYVLKRFSNFKARNA